jgi:hypothetical protein
MNERNKQVKELFQLSVDEEIFFDFSCSIQLFTAVPGRLYLSDKHLCFSSSLLGIETKVSIFHKFF